MTDTPPVGGGSGHGGTHRSEPGGQIALLSAVVWGLSLPGPVLYSSTGKDREIEQARVHQIRMTKI